MTACRDDMLAPDLPPLDGERLARMAEATEWLHAPEPISRRSRRWLYAEAAVGVIGIVALVCGALLVLP